jgi:hypothetical protein
MNKLADKWTSETRKNSTKNELMNEGMNGWNQQTN